MSAIVHFGGPDKPARALRDVLEAKVDAVPPGGAIDWVTYYFRDRALAEALVRARARGVHVRLCVEAQPRIRSANRAAIALLRDGLGAGLRVLYRMLGASHLHTKLYCFSHPRPHALIGSFNPSGNRPEDPAVITDIGDQDRGHNMLVEIDDPAFVEAMVSHVSDLHAGRNGPAMTAYAGHYHAYAFPRWGTNPLDRSFSKLGSGSRLRIATSHVRDPAVAAQLGGVVKRGGEVSLLTHHTERRSPEALLRRIRGQGVQTSRYEHPESLPMHAKFVLVEQDRNRWGAFGSYNLTRTSRWLNRELLVFSSDEAIWRALDERWNAILAEPWCRHDG